MSTGDVSIDARKDTYISLKTNFEPSNNPNNNSSSIHTHHNSSKQKNRLRNMQQFSPKANMEQSNSGSGPEMQQMIIQSDDGTPSAIGLSEGDMDLIRIKQSANQRQRARRRKANQHKSNDEARDAVPNSLMTNDPGMDTQSSVNGLGKSSSGLLANNKYRAARGNSNRNGDGVSVGQINFGRKNIPKSERIETTGEEPFQGKDLSSVDKKALCETSATNTQSSSISQLMQNKRQQEYLSQKKKSNNNSNIEDGNSSASSTLDNSASTPINNSSNSKGKNAQRKNNNTLNTLNKKKLASSTGATIDTMSTSSNSTSSSSSSANAATSSSSILPAQQPPSQISKTTRAPVRRPPSGAGKTFKMHESLQRNALVSPTSIPLQQSSANVTKTEVKIGDLTSAELSAIRLSELQAICKRFPKFEVLQGGASELSKSAETGIETKSFLFDPANLVVVEFDFIPSDPEWPFAVESIRLNFTFPVDYPKSACSVKVLPEAMPERFTYFITSALDAQLRAYHQYMLTTKQPTMSETSSLSVSSVADPSVYVGFMMVRPFARWIDKNIERIFVESGKKVRHEEEVKKCGIKIVSQDDLKKKFSTGIHTEKDNSKVSGLATATNTHFATPVQSASISLDTDVSDELREKILAMALSAPPDSEDDEQSHSSDSQSGSSSDDDSDEQGAHSYHQLEEQAKDSSEADKLPRVREQKSGPSPGSTEVRISGLELEGVGVISMDRIAVILACDRCRTPTEALLKTLISTNFTCTTCHSPFSARFKSQMAHLAMPTFGYLEMASCSLKDITPHDCHINFQCEQCSQATPIRSSPFVIGDHKMHVCRHCFHHMKMRVGAITFQQHGTRATETSDASPSVKKNKKKPSAVADPNIKLGTPLPDKGTCKHYGKSYRWLRFPCCGRAFPCDQCHESNNPDGHAMKWATRAICGFCAREQNYTDVCKSCGNNMTGSGTSTRYWEGGAGCRNTKFMTKKDNHKYSNSHMKTHSRKSERVGKKPEKEKEKEHE